METHNEAQVQRDKTYTLFELAGRETARPDREEGDRLAHHRRYGSCERQRFFAVAGKAQGQRPASLSISMRRKGCPCGVALF